MPHTKGAATKNQPLLPSPGHGSNTITMMLLAPQGTVLYPIGAPNEHSLHTKIMEKSLALFFYCYQSVVHLQSSLSLTPLPLALSSLLSIPFTLYLSTPAPSVDLTLCPVFPPCSVETDLWDTRGGGLALSIKAPSYLLWFLLCSIHEPIQPIVQSSYH